MFSLVKSIILVSFFSFIFSYDVGDTISETHQNMEVNVCYGDYPTSTLKLSDFNGATNGGDYKVFHIDMTASW